MRIVLHNLYLFPFFCTLQAVTIIMANSDCKAPFSHKFSGYSVWLEPCPSESAHLKDIVTTLANRTSSGSKFAPHCTMLYNVSPDNIRRMHADEQKHLGNKALEDLLIQLLEQVKGQFLKHADVVNGGRDTSEENGSGSGASSVMITPTDFFYFPYPKTADNGKGFGCLILMLLLEKGYLLELLHKIIVDVFPGDERHAEEGGQFQPHMALCYAPEYNTWLEDEKIRMEEDEDLRSVFLSSMRGHYLSLWKTEGLVREWECIHKVEL